MDLIVDAIRTVDAARPVWVSFAFPDEWTADGVAIRSGEGVFSLIERRTEPHLRRVFNRMRNKPNGASSVDSGSALS